MTSEKKYAKGFTLMELLVVLAIISLLASVIFTSISASRVKARNAQRISQIKELLNAFNIGLTAVGGSFPNPGPNACVSATCYGVWSSYGANPAVDAILLAGISQKPVDPSGGDRVAGGYVYYYDTTGGISPYTGKPYPSGITIAYAVELPVSSTSCGPGMIFNVYATYVYCMAYP